MMIEGYVYIVIPSAKYKRTRKLAKKQGHDTAWRTNIIVLFSTSHILRVCKKKIRAASCRPEIEF
jgi:hypothetical protein